MGIITNIARIIREVLGKEANRLAWETGFMEREREVTGSSFAVGLVSAWQASPQSSLAGLSQAIGNAGTPITRQALDKRFDTEAVDFLKALSEVCLQQAIEGLPTSHRLMRRFSAICLVDSSIITLPNAMAEMWHGSGGYGDKASRAAMKLSVRWELVQGRISHLDVSHATVHDRQASAHNAPVEAGSLQIRDLGYFKLDDLEAIGQQDAFWLTRYKLHTILLDQAMNRIDLPHWLPQTVGETCDVAVYVGQHKQLPARLVAQRVPLEVVEQRHERIKETARQNQTRVSEEALAMAHWTIYLTNLPRSRADTNEIFILGRFRWQIELLFKLWKSELGINQWRSQKPERILCEIYAKLIVAMVTHWFLLMACWDNPRRSLTQAMPTIRGLAWQWANSLSREDFLVHVLESIRRSLSKCFMDASQQHPRFFQLGNTCYA